MVLLYLALIITMHAMLALGQILLSWLQLVQNVAVSLLTGNKKNESAFL